MAFPYVNLTLIKSISKSHNEFAATPHRQASVSLTRKPSTYPIRNPPFTSSTAPVI
jgi:hypothetical protein